MNRVAHSLLNRNANTFCRLAFSRLLSEQKKKINFDDLVKGKPVVVFMKGTPDAPQCGFSNGVCQILKVHGVNNFQTYNVLEDEDIRQGIKEYTNWPTIPQIFFNGEFLGGCDIMLDMHRNGELIDELQKLGIRSALLDASDEGDNKKS